MGKLVICDNAHMERRNPPRNINLITFSGELQMKTIQTMSAAVLLAMLTACGNTADGAKKDAQNAADC